MASHKPQLSLWLLLERETVDRPTEAKPHSRSSEAVGLQRKEMIPGPPQSRQWQKSERTFAVWPTNFVLQQILIGGKQS